MDRSASPCSLTRRALPGPKSRAAVALAVSIAAAAAPHVASAQGTPARWTVAPNATLTLGADEADTAGTFSVVVGATRLPDGRILVGDRGDYTLRVFSADGRFERAFGRKGAGPGEIGYLASLFRCGDSLVTKDIEARRISVFSLRGGYVRAFRFGSPQAGRPPYYSACNRAGTFVHYGWEDMRDVKGGAYRPVVPFWLSRTDSAVGRVLGSFAGSERYGMVRDGQVRGSRPLPLGRQTSVAVGADRVFVGTADRYEILVFDLDGTALSPIRLARPAVSVTRADVEYVKGQDLSLVPEARRAAAAVAFAEIPTPKTLPAYNALAVDALDHLWVQDYPRAGSPRVAWSVFDAQGTLVAQTELPTFLQVYEIGTDYVLGRYLDPDEAIPQVRLYRLDRTPRR